MKSDLILLPAIALAAWTAVVWLWMYIRRIAVMRRLRIPAQALANKERARQLLTDAAPPADNLANLFELPVLFYAVLIMFHITGGASVNVLLLAWSYVGLRIAHSLIHITYNRVMHRFGVYVISSLVLFTLWALLALRIPGHLTD